MDRACARAVELGVPAVAFTEHVEFTSCLPGDALAVDDPVLDWWSAIQPLDVAGYFACVSECRERYPDLRITAGIETGEPHLFADSVRRVLSSGPFHRVLGSLHAIVYGGRLTGIDRLLYAHDPDTIMRTYFRELVTMIENSDVFGVLAHVDYPRRYWPAGTDAYRETDFEDEYRAVFRALAGTGRALELNTKSPLASVTLLDWWRDSGGTAVSFGSDAHRPWLVGTRFALAVDIVEAAGFRPGRDPADFWHR